MSLSAVSCAEMEARTEHNVWLPSDMNAAEVIIAVIYPFIRAQNYRIIAKIAPSLTHEGAPFPKVLVQELDGLRECRRACDALRQFLLLVARAERGRGFETRTGRVDYDGCLIGADSAHRH